jgi:F0F1-type ATP synthase beta subunit
MTQYKDALELIHSIQSSHKGSIGSINNVYLPQLDREAIDALAAALASQGERDAAAEALYKAANELLLKVEQADEEGDLSEIVDGKYMDALNKAIRAWQKVSRR